MNKKIEEFSLNAWPALQNFVYDGWLLRFANGFTKRSNSINPIYDASEQNTQEKIQNCETIYTSVGLDTIFKVTPFVIPKNIDSILDKRGYDVVDLSSVQVIDLSAIEEPVTTNVNMKTEINNEWIDILSDFNNLSDSNAEITKKLFSVSYLKKGFFTLYDNSVPVACGAGVIEQNYVGLYDIVTNSRYRNRGYGRELILHILKWAKVNGASQSYLQVVKSNAPALKLYEGLGYQEIYTYWYRHKKLL
ncbi:GNAT family N-acetyltransferase [Paenibacillus crassostreae]|uniref:GCN5 family acetyltransferase n=1 Tax=Paenibacillus crassostreae TaxID=1763538 RepID=A0A167DVY0_9BACL|nr:GNAT family N-acetyltransferase [Paenibacillus crassostreae]AOZ90997.1 GNAT family N-acetyltransferase [Paenibacillus crassostreae]OAB74840.1 GCN5 family acetyltransferase [Paenibacillus crassostreae]